MINIRHVGSYEIVFVNEDNKRIKEVVTDLSLAESTVYAKSLKEELKADSFYISKVIVNSKYDAWKVGE